MNNISYHHDSTQKLELQMNSLNSTKAMEIIPTSTNAMEGSIQNHSNYLNLGTDNGSDGNDQGKYLCKLAKRSM